MDDVLDTTHELEVRLSLLGELDDWSRLRVRGTKPRLETSSWFLQWAGRISRGETREDTVTCLSTTVRAVEERVARGGQEAGGLRARCTAASTGVHRLAATTYADDTRTAAALRLLAGRLAAVGKSFAGGHGDGDGTGADSTNFRPLGHTRPPFSPTVSPTSALEQSETQP